MDPPAWRETQVDFFHNLGNHWRPLEFIPASRERVVPTQWQVRTVLGDCISRAGKGRVEILNTPLLSVSSHFPLPPLL